MKEHLFCISVSFASVEFKEVVKLPEDMSDEEIEAEFEEWVWSQIDAYREEI